MNNLKVGSILEFTGDDLDKKVYLMEVRGVCDNIIFTRDIRDEGKFGPTTYNDIDDIVTWGWKLKI